MHCYSIEYPCADKAESFEYSAVIGAEQNAALRLLFARWRDSLAAPPEPRPHKKLSMRVSDMPIAVC